ncbi:hypothetical protein HMPREF1544_09913 [Mucor circinelloides 1006PhL]|uniref:Peptidase S59 domain-containing protein n=1 Tax=Mucor circinelloides f. circinelloides (strain 1006PhL) TaxID=1220926 RepID=S2JLB2_MUCC1|nr:hypothetical protein HMPREF1544_09913 [Mucor circinelloides 1006PhL]
MVAPTTSAFGSTAAQPSGGLFGQRPATSAFGSAPTTSAFGQPQQQQTSAFGGMGSTGSAFGQPANAAAGGVNQGTAIADFSPTQDRDITTGVNNFFQTITAMPQYKNYSLEELRLQDYQQNRKTAGGAAGGTGAFGAPAGGAFGSNTSTTSAFGQPAASTGGFGQPQTSAFGQPAQTSAFGAGATGATGGGLFGQQQQPATTSAFGQPAGTSAFGASTSAFGQPAATSGFGAGANTGGAFGAAASKPFSFGSTPAPATGGFGQPATSAFGQPAASTGAFGQQQPATTSAFGGFGQKPATTPATGGFGTGFGQPAATGGFGQPAATGGFGASTSKPASSFSFGAAAPAPATGGFGTGFGATSAPATGGFGQPATGGLFGAAKPAAPTTSLFGNTGANTGATGGFGGFGAGATGATGTTGGLFGQKPATGLGGTGGGLFSNNTMGGNTSGFGGFGQQQQQGTNSFNLPAQGGLTSFGTNPLQPGMQQQPLIATVDKNPYGNNPLFDLSKVSSTPSGLKSGASAVALDGSSRKSSSPHYPISPRVVSKIKLRGFSFQPAKSNARQAPTNNLEGISDDAVLGSGAFAPRNHSKKLVFDSDIDAAGIANLFNSKKSDKKRALFDPQLEHLAARENSTTKPATTTPATATSTTTTTTTTTIISEVTATKDASSGSKNAASSSNASNVALKNDYYISPSLDTLASMPKEGLKHVQNLVVGRKGFGEVRFDQPVDLTDVVLEDIMGNIVVIEEKTVVVYPDQDNKPAKGTQLNLPATVKIENCFSHDKNTGAPITDPTHPRFGLFKERLRKRENVEFVDYSDNGEWTFKVQEF